MNHAQKRRMMIAIIAAVGSLLAVTVYIEGGIPEQNIVNADQPDSIQAVEK